MKLTGDVREGLGILAESEDMHAVDDQLLTDALRPDVRRDKPSKMHIVFPDGSHGQTIEVPASSPVERPSHTNVDEPTQGMQFVREDTPPQTNGAILPEQMAGHAGVMRPNAETVHAPQMSRWHKLAGSLLRIRGALVPVSADRLALGQGNPATQHALPASQSPAGNRLAVPAYTFEQPPRPARNREEIRENQKWLDAKLDFLTHQLNRKLNTVYLFNKTQMKSEAIQLFSNKIADQARGYARRIANLGDIQSIVLGEGESWRDSGVKVLQILLDRNANLGTSNELITVLHSNAGEQVDRLFSEGRIDPFSKRSRTYRKGRKPQIGDLEYLTSDEAWRIIEDSVLEMGNLAVAQAHRDFFERIDVLPDGRIIQRSSTKPANPQEREKAFRDDEDEIEAPEIVYAPMVEDFNDLISALGESAVVQTSGFENGSFIHNINLPLQIDPNDAMSRLTRLAGKNIRTINHPKFGSFIAVVRHQGSPETGNRMFDRFLVLGFNQSTQIPEPEVDEQRLPSKGLSTQLIINNTNSEPPMAEEAMQIPLFVWKLTRDGYEIMQEIVSKAGTPFVDFRSVLMPVVQELVIPRIQERQELMGKAALLLEQMEVQTSDSMRVLSSGGLNDIMDNPSIATIGMLIQTLEQMNREGLAPGINNDGQNHHNGHPSLTSGSPLPPPKLTTLPPPPPPVPLSQELMQPGKLSDDDNEVVVGEVVEES